MQLALFGGIYNNYLALEAAIGDARRRGVDGMYCLGDLGAFGPHPDRVFPLLHEAGVQCIQGNYDDSIGRDLKDCQCGYTDPRDNYFAQISFDYTYNNTSLENRLWLRGLPTQLRLHCDGLQILLCHGSPRKTNEFLWESTTSTHFLDKLADDYQAHVIVATHTGLPWQRALSGGRRFVNVGVLGRPANDGKANVWYAILRTGVDVQPGQGRGPSRSAPPRFEGSASAEPCSHSHELFEAISWRHAPDRLDEVPTEPGSTHPAFDIEFVPIRYDHARLAREMQLEGLPDEFVETILTGWWTTCLEILPAKERRRGRF